MPIARRLAAKRLLTRALCTMGDDNTKTRAHGIAMHAHENRKEAAMHARGSPEEHAPMVESSRREENAMQAKDVLKSLFGRGKHSTYDASERMGKSQFYVNTIVSQGRMPKLDTMAAVMDAIDYDLLVRSRQDGSEIIIDPPEE